MTAQSVQKPVVSVALATYNGAAFVEEQLRSLRDQTRLPDELVVTDDGSDDGTVELVKAFASTVSFDVRISVNDQRLGPAHNFGEALRRCRGDVVFLCDQDDVWFAEKIERILEVLAVRPSIQLVVHDRVVADQDLKHHGTSELDNFRRIGMSDDSYVSGCCSVVRRPLLDTVLPIPDAVRGHDSWIHLLGRMLGVRSVLPESLIYYRRHDANVSATTTASVVPLPGVRGRLNAKVNKMRRARGRSHVEAISATGAVYRACVDRLAAVRDDPGRLAGVTPSTVLAARSEAQRMLAASEARVGALALPRWRRLGSVLAAFEKGHYRGFDVPGALLLDLLAVQPGAGIQEVDS